MSTELRALYGDVIVDHSKRPRNFRALRGRARVAEGSNPLCGDTLTVYVDVTNGVLHDVTFQGSGCAIFTASASLMTEILKGRSEAEARRICERFRTMVISGVPASPVAEIGALAAFAGVRQFPSRVKCALLAWQTIEAALQHRAATVSTE